MRIIGRVVRCRSDHSYRTGCVLDVRMTYHPGLGGLTYTLQGACDFAAGVHHRDMLVLFSIALRRPLRPVGNCLVRRSIRVLETSAMSHQIYGSGQEWCAPFIPHSDKPLKESL